jgi:hypothetical protein
MTTLGDPVATVAVTAPEPVAVRWHPITRLAFRFTALYFSLYVLTSQMFGSLVALPGIAGPGGWRPVQEIVSWVAADLLGFSRPLVLVSGSGDKPYDYAHAALLLALAVIGTAIGSVVRGGTPAYPRLHAAFRIFLRFSLGATMVAYGMAKAVPLQMPFPSLTRLLEPYGNFSLMGVLWSQIGASPPYERLIGVIEVVSGVLLFVPGLTPPGALLSLLVSAQVFSLNMTYDVPVKLFSLHLVVMSLVLLAPDARRLVDLLVLNRAVPAASRTPLARRALWRRAGAGLQFAAGAWLLAWNGFGTAQFYRTVGAGAPEPPLHGIWTVETLAIDGEVRTPLVTDSELLRRVVIQGPNTFVVQHMDDTFSYYGAKVDPRGKTIALTRMPSTRGGTPPEVGRLTFEQPSAAHLVLDGTIDGSTVRMELKLFDHAKMPLLQSRFRWVQDYPFNR